MALWSLDDLEALVGRDALLGVLDRNNDGVVDEAAVALLQQESDAWILGYVRGNHDYAQIVELLAADPPAQLRRLSLHYARVRLYQDNPEFFRQDWMALFEALRAEALDVQRGRFRLDIGSATSPWPRNVGGVVVDGAGRDVPLCDFAPPVFSKMGDW